MGIKVEDNSRPKLGTKPASTNAHSKSAVGYVCVTTRPCKVASKLQVQRIREIEVGQVKLAEAARWRRALQVERAELERLYSDRVARLRTQEEALVAKMREQCREVECAAFEQRQRVAEEDERMRAMHAVCCYSAHLPNVKLVVRSFYL
jgi:hypothetical protein